MLMGTAFPPSPDRLSPVGGQASSGYVPERLRQGHRKVDEAVKILLTANSGEERLAMKSGFFESAPVGS